MSFDSDIKAHIAKYNLFITQIFQDSCANISLDIAEGTPVSTGKLLGSWTPSKDSQANYDFRGGVSAWGNGTKKDNTIAETNKLNALANLAPRIEEVTGSITKEQKYYFTNSVDYAYQAEFDGWLHTDKQHMMTNAISNWQSIVEYSARELNGK